MSPDVDLTLPRPGRHRLRDRLLGLDSRLFEFAAAQHWPGAEPVLPRLSRSANHGVLWFATAAAMAASRTPRARRAAVRGVASLALASLTINTLGKRSVRRRRPGLDPVPLVRQLKRQPITTSFPSGHAASAAAFATGVGAGVAGLGRRGGAARLLGGDVAGLHRGALPERRPGGCGAGRGRRVRRTAAGADAGAAGSAGPAARAGAGAAGR
jgi:hypothetical protein